MFRVAREIDFCYGHRLLNYGGKCRYLHGHNGRVLVTIEAPQLDERGMVCDFSEIKRIIERWIDEHMDHRMVLHRADPAVPLLRGLGEPLFLMDANPTAENIARVILEVAQAQGLPVVKVQLWETPRCAATYCPCTTPAVKISWESVLAMHSAARDELLDKHAEEGKR